MDEEHSLDNGFDTTARATTTATAESRSSSRTALMRATGSTAGSSRTTTTRGFVSIVKYESTPFEAYLSESVLPERHCGVIRQ